MIYFGLRFFMFICSLNNVYDLFEELVKDAGNTKRSEPFILCKNLNIIYFIKIITLN